MDIDISRHKRRVALISMVASGGLAAAKFVVGLLTGSLAVLSDAIHSLVDFGATAITYFAVRVADKPADDDHTYGHAKIESLAALAECALLFGAAGWIAIEAVRSLIHGAAEIESGWLAVATLIVAIAVDFWRQRALSKAADDTSSQALASAALHFASDMLSSLVVLLGLGAVWLGIPAADAVAALVVAVFITLAAWRLARRTVDVLIDAAPDGLPQQLSELIDDVPGVVRVERVRVRPAGPALFVETVVEVDRSRSLEQVAELKERVRAAIAGQHAEAEVMVETHPVALDDESVAARVRTIAHNRGLAVHHLTVQNLNGRRAVSLDLEVDGDLPLSAAHDIADGLECAIRDDLGGDVEVETHIEPLDQDDLSGQDADHDLRIAIAAELATYVREGGVLSGVHDVRVRSVGDVLVVNFHVRADEALSVRATHDAIDAVERRLRRERPEVKRVVGHAEPEASLLVKR